MSLSLKKRRTVDISGNDEPSTSKKRRCDESNSSALLSQSQILGGVRCGKVIKMHLVNFMCHSNWTIDFHSRVNFLVGSNGSGKSAVLVALMIGLGAKTRSTHRSTTLKQLIKTGESAAKIEITISNEGPDAYEPDSFGNAITVVRNITQTASTYVIKNEAGHIISRKTDDLHRILMYHNIQVDNPVFVLDQDSAREFLKDLEPSKNYKLFLKATQIEMITEKLNDCLQSFKEHQIRLGSHQKKLDEVQEEIAELKDRYKQLMSFNQINDVLAKTERERLWLLVSQQEENLREFCEKIQILEQKRESLQDSVQNRDEAEKDLKEKIKEFERQIATKGASVSENNSLYMQLKSQVDKMSSRCSEIQSYLQSFNKKTAFLEKQIKELENHIEERSKDNVEDIAQMRLRNEAALIELKKKSCDNKAIIGTAKQDMKMFIDSKIKLEEHITKIKTERREVDDEIRRLQSLIRNIQGSSKDKMSIYGENMCRFLIEIEKHHRAGKFSQMPRGPIGKYIDVSNSKYRDVVENQLGKLLNAFIVNNSRDRLVLENILKGFRNFRPTIITSRFISQVYDVRRGFVDPPRGSCLLMQQIKCPDPVVMNCLIDQIQVETILLTENKEIAEQITSSRENVPQNLSKVLVPNLGLEYYPDPNYRMYSLNLRPARFIQVNVEDRIDQLEAEKAEKEVCIKKFEQELTAIGPQLREEVKRIEEKRAVVDRYETNNREIQEKIHELEHFEYPEHNEIDILKNELVENRQKLKDVVEKIGSKKTELTEAMRERERVESDMKAQLNVMRTIEREINSIKKDSEEVRMQLRSLINNLGDKQDKISRINDKLNELKHTKKSKEAELSDYIKKADEKGERIHTEKTEEQLTEDIKRLKAKLKHALRTNDDPNELEELIKAKEESLKADQVNYKQIKLAIHMLHKSLRKRFDLIRRLKQHMVLILQFSFNSILKTRNFSGTIEVDHDNKTLEVSVVPRDNHLANAVSSTRALSGGERSYATVALLISLWSCVDHPFYFLDEYDVFTDQVNREFMTRLLIDEGKKKRNRQYSFLTPQDMSILSDDIIKIHKFREPDRR